MSLKLTTEREARAACEKSGADYHVFIQIRDRDGKPQVRVAYPCSKEWARKVANLTLPSSKQRMGKLS